MQVTEKLNIAASTLLGKGGTYEEVVAILGDSPATIRRYHANWNS